MSRPEALQERVFTKLFEAAEIAKFTKEQYEAYEDSLKVYRDWKNTIETAELKAEKKGRIKGKMEEKKEMAQKMLQRGFSLDDIAAITGLSKADIDNII
jgi:predicted transposase/invertase (TIGR01784 family)